VIVLHRGRVRAIGPARCVVAEAGASGLQDAFERLTRLAA
jgi:hypothetical protein